MYTFHDFTKDQAKSLANAVANAISYHRASQLYKTAVDADSYDAQRNSTIMKFSKMLYDFNGNKVPDPTAANSRLCNNYFNRLNTQRMTYSMGNGIQFAKDGVKERFGPKFDTVMQHSAYYGLIHGVSFLMWNIDRLNYFPVTEFAPLWDEYTGALRAGVRFWQLDSSKPAMAILFEEDGYTVLQGESNFGSFKVVEEKRSYIVTTRRARADAEPEVIAEENYSTIPIVPLYGSRLKQSTLVGMKGKLDSYDLIESGFADDLKDCSEIYWLINGAGGMDAADLAEFRERLKFNHIANVTDGDDVSVNPYTQEIPYSSRQAFLTEIRSGLYEDFGALDVHTVAAGATNDHIDAAYQPMDENADDFELQIIEAVEKLEEVIGMDYEVPLFKRNRISNERETTEMILAAANYLDDETVLTKLPFITPDEIPTIIERKLEEEVMRYGDDGDGGEGNSGEGEE